MDRERWQRVSEVFQAVADLEGAALERALAERCGDDQALRREVESLLAAGSDAAPWLAGLTARAGIPNPEAETILNAPGREIGNWRLVRQIGRGGMGVVYLAERADGQFEMRGALKALPVGLVTPGAVARFEREREILAGLDHPGIARLVDGGVTPEGTPFYVMEYVEGLPLHRYCEEHDPSLDQRLRLFERIAEAVAYAHRHLVIHRDIKPANVQVTDRGEPKLLDFGVAKLLDAESEPAGTATQLGQRRVTPAYTAPELIQGEPATTACDVYSLGVVLYELLAGTPPFEPGFFDQPGWTDRMAEYRPPPPSRAGSDERVRGDLDTIAAMAMHPDPARRYPTVNALLADLERHRIRLPVSAQPDTVGYRMNRFLRRHAVGFTLSAVAAISLVAGTGVALWQAQEARQALENTERALDRAQAIRGFLLGLFEAAGRERPRDELPTTQEILELGAEQALDESSAPPVERMVMLVTIGEIYRQLAREQRAEKLFDEAIELARESREVQSAALADALLRKAWVVRDQDDLARSQQLLEEAEPIAARADVNRDQFLKIRAQRAWNELLMGNESKAIRITEPVYREILDSSAVDMRSRIGILNSMKTAYSRVGRLKDAASLADDLIELTREWKGKDSHTYAVMLANSIPVLNDLGRFELAETRAERALALYDRIYPENEPSEYRAALRQSFAHTLLYQGRFEEALEEVTAANEEWAGFVDKPVSDWAHHFRLRGSFLALMQRWAPAAEDLRRARTLYLDDEPDDPSRLTEVTARLAGTLCAQDQFEKGTALLDSINTEPAALEALRPGQRSAVRRALGECVLRHGQPKKAYKHAQAGLDIEKAYAGHLLERARLRMLKARSLAARQRYEQAVKELDHGRELFIRHDLTEHPFLDEIRALRNRYEAGGIEARVGLENTSNTS